MCHDRSAKTESPQRQDRQADAFVALEVASEREERRQSIYRTCPSYWTCAVINCAGTSISAKGSFSGTTCGQPSRYRLNCNPSGTPEALFAVPVGAGGQYSLSISSGFSFAWVASDDPNVAGNCDVTTASSNHECLTTDSRGLSSAYGFWYSVQKTGGGCGAFTLTVN